MNGIRSILNYGLACDFHFSLINSKIPIMWSRVIHTIVFHVTRFLPYQNFTSWRKFQEFSVVSVSSKSKFCARPFHPTSCPLLQWQRERDGITLSLTFAAPVLRWRHKSVMFRWSDNDNDPFTNNPKDQWSTRGNHCRYCQVSKALQSQKTCQMVMKQCSIPDLTDLGLLLDTSSRRCWTTRV